MKYVIVIAYLAVAVFAEKYTDKYDNINMQEILENPRLLNAYVDCIMERGKCTSEGKELKEHLQEAIETGCEKCTKPQEDGAATAINYLIEKEPAIWREVAEKYDPTGKWRKQYEERAKAKGIKIPDN